MADFTYVPMDTGRFGCTAFVIDAFAGLIPDGNDEPSYVRLDDRRC